MSAFWRVVWIVARKDLAIEARNMHFYYSKFRAVKNVDLSIAPKKIGAFQ